MAAQDVLEAALAPRGEFQAACRPEHLIALSLNIGDGDGHVLLVPEAVGRRRAVIIDVVDANKLHHLLLHLSAAKLLDTTGPTQSSSLLQPIPTTIRSAEWRRPCEPTPNSIGEVWEPGYYQPTDAYLREAPMATGLPVLAGLLRGYSVPAQVKIFSRSAAPCAEACLYLEDGAGWKPSPSYARPRNYHDR